VNLIPKIPPIALLIAGVLVLAYGMSLLTAVTRIGESVDGASTVRGILVGAGGVAGIVAGCVGLAFRRAR
jgi:hypothetical protein